jgi:hypothetical protein
MSNHCFVDCHCPFAKSNNARVMRRKYVIKIATATAPTIELELVPNRDARYNNKFPGINNKFIN